MTTEHDETLAAGVIGVGAMGQHHARVYGELSEIELVGVVDEDWERAREIGAEYGVQTFELDKLLERVDLVSVVVPTAYHYDTAMQCIEAGVNVLIEKPIAETPEQGRQLARAADQAGVTLQVGHIERFNPATQTVLDVVEDLDVIAMEAERLGPTPDRDIEDTAVIDLMIHDIDVACSLVDSDVASVDAIGNANGRHATANLEFADGTMCTLTASRVTQKKVRELRITAKECYVTVDYIDKDVQIHRQSVPEYVTKNGNVRYRHQSVVENPVVGNGEPLKRELSAFAMASRNEAEAEVTGADGIRALELAQEIDQQAFASKQPEVTGRATDD